MLHVISTLSDPLLALIRDDPVRPEIPPEFRVRQPNNLVFALCEGSEVLAMVCVSAKDSVPCSVTELISENSGPASVAVFYTIWSYRPGAGRRLIQSAVQWISEELREIREFITLSPPTEMARDFHLRNGARVYRVNSDSVNYQYVVAAEKDQPTRPAPDHSVVL